MTRRDQVAADAVIIDAGVGNLGNLERALRHVAPDASIQITSDAERIAAADVLLLPGVGAFRPPRETLRGAMEEGLRSALDGGAFLLGICVGFQLLFEESDEFGSTDGLGLVPGRITRLPDDVSLPHIGWNRLLDCRSHALVEGLDGEYAYFVHSFAPESVPDDLVLATCRHGRRFPAVVANGRVMGTQFHPEKSGAVGLEILRRFLALAGLATTRREQR